MRYPRQREIDNRQSPPRLRGFHRCYSQIPLGDESIIKDDKLVFEIVDIILSYMLSHKRNVIYDATNLRIETRIRYIEIAKSYGAYVTVHWVNCPLKVAIERNAQRERHVPILAIKRFHRSLQAPTIAEGMDKIIMYS